MKILLLEDEKDVANATREAFPKHHFTCVQNIIDLHKHIKNPQVLYNFDYFLFDLAVDVTPHTIEVYKKAIPELFINNGIESTLTVLDGIRLMGWDYFTRVIWTDNRFSIARTSKCVLVTGYSNNLERHNLLSGYKGIQLIQKNGTHAYNELENHLN
jgi:hypothetical protein